MSRARVKRRKMVARFGRRETEGQAWLRALGIRHTPDPRRVRLVTVRVQSPAAVILPMGV